MAIFVLRGGFQAGVTAAAVIFSTAFGLADGAQAGPQLIVESMMAIGAPLYGGVGIAGLLLGGNYLDYFVLDPILVHALRPRHPLGRGRGGDHGGRGDAQDLLHVRRARPSRRMTTSRRQPP